MHSIAELVFDMKGCKRVRLFIVYYYLFILFIYLLLFIFYVRAMSSPEKFHLKITIIIIIIGQR